MTPQELEAALNALGMRLFKWWVWPLFMVLVGLAAVIPALVIYPMPGVEQLYLAGYEWGGACLFREQVGIPCPACGMTRSWVWAARGALPTAFTYNAAGASLFLWLVGSGALGSLRLIRRDGQLLKVPIWWVTGIAMFWLLVAFAGLFVLRGLGVNPLP